MAGKDGFKYIINAELKLNTGSLKQVLEDIQSIDKNIKAHFNNKEGGIKVPLSVEKDITKLQGDVKRIIDGYNRGQAPAIKVPIVTDETSIAKLQSRISEIKKQLNSLSDSKEPIRLNTSLVVQREEADAVQKQVNEIVKPVVEVTVVPSAESLKKLQEQVEAVKTEVQTTIATQPASAYTVGRYQGQNPSNSVGRVTRDAVKKIRERSFNTTGNSKADKFLAGRKQITDEMKTIKDMQKAYQEEFKAIDDLADYKEKLEKRVADLNKKSGQSKVYYQDDYTGGKRKQTNKDQFDIQKAEWESQIAKIDQLISTKKILEEKEKQLANYEKSFAYDGRSKENPQSTLTSSHDASKIYQKIEAQRQADKEKQDAIDKANKEREANLKKQQQEQQKFDSQMASEERKQENKKYQQDKRNKASQQKKEQNKQVRLGGTGYSQALNIQRQIDLQKHLANQPKYYDNYVDLVKQRDSVAGQISSIENAIGGKSASNKSQYSEQAQSQVADILAKKRAELAELDKKVNDARENAQKQTDVISRNDKSGLGNHWDSMLDNEHTSKVNQWLQNEIQKNRVHDVGTAHEMAQQDYWTMYTRVHNPEQAYTQATRINNRQKKQQEEEDRQRRADLKQQQKTQTVNDTILAHNNHMRSFGPYNMYSAHSMIDALRDPNVSLADSKEILGHLNQYQATQSRAQGMNFQRSYAIRYLDEKGNMQEVNTMVYQYTKLGEVIEKADKGFLGMMEHVMSKAGVFSILEMGIVGFMTTLTSSITEMVQFNQQLAEIQSTTQNLNNTNLKPFYNTAGGSNQLQSQIQSNAFSIGKQFGVDTLNTVMPIEQSVVARPDLTATNNKYDSSKENQIVKNIMQFSAISTGGKEDEETVNELTNDLLSLYQANQTANPKGYMNDMSSMLDNLSSMHSYGVNTTSITNAMAELAPETLQQGINSNQAMSMMGAFSLSNAGGSPEDTENIGKTFYNTLMHANTNQNLKDTLSETLGINLDANPMKTPDLINEILKQYPKLKDNEVAKQELAMALSSSGGGGQQSKAMTPLMVKFLEGTQSQNYKTFMKNSQDGSTKGAMDNAWGPYSKTLKTDIESLVQSFKQLAQLMGQLGVADTFGVILKGVTGVLDAVDSLLGGMQKLSGWFKDKHMFDLSEFTTTALGFLGTIKLIQKFFNKKQWGGYVGSAIGSTNPWGYSFGIKKNAPIGIGTVASDTTLLASNGLVTMAQNNQNKPVVANNFRNTATNVAENAVKTDENATLQNVMTFTEADLMANTFRTNPAVNRLTNEVEKSAISTAESGAGRINSVGGFVQNALFIPQVRNGVNVMKNGGYATFMESLIGGFKNMLPALLDFGLLLTRLTVVGGALFVAYEGVKFIADEINKGNQGQNKQTQNNIENLHQQIAKNPNLSNEIQKNVQDLISYKKSSQSGLAENSLNRSKFGIMNSDQKKGENNADFLSKYGIQYHKTLSGKDYITYQTGVDKNGKAITDTYHVGNNKEKKAFNDFLNNGMVTDTKKIADQWAVNTSYLGAYANELKVVNTLTANLTDTMKQVDSATKGIDATFGGINSSDALQQKIKVTQQGMTSIQTQLKQLEDTMNTMGSNKDKLSGQYSTERSKILASGVSDSSISKMETDMMVARANGKDPNEVINNYKKDPKMADLATLFNTLQDFMTAFNGTDQQFLSAKDQYSQMTEQQKQYQQQLAITKLNLDAMNASLQALGNVASASKALVDINANTLQTGDNSYQISALHTSMGISTSQMGMMVGQNNAMQQQMAEIAKNNPNQDFSLQQLYNPKGEVTPEQMAYKTLYEQSQQMTQNISNQSDAMYQQLSQLKDLVLNSNEYADSWARVQQTVQDVKDAIKNANDFQYQMSTVNDNASITSALTGQKLTDVKQQLLGSMLNSSVDLTTKLNTDGASIGHDTSMLSQAWQDIINAEGKNFQDNMINPLKNIVSSASNSNTAFGNSVSSFNTAVNNFSGAVKTANDNASIAQQAQSEGAPAPSSSNYQGTASTGKDTNTGRTFKLGFQEQDYAQSLKDIVGGVYAKNDNQQDFVYAGSQYGVDPNLLASIAMAENSGNSSLLNATNNVGSIKAGGSWKGATYTTSTGTYRKYSSLQDGINDLAQLIASKISNGYNTIPLINSNYAQSPDWMNAVAYFMAKGTNTTTQTWLGNATSSSGYHLSGNDGGDPSYKGSGSNGSNSGATTTSNLHLRSTPSTNGKIIETLPAGTTYKTYGEQNGWVNLGNGWASAQYLTGNFNSAGGSSSTSTSGAGGVNGMFSWLNSVKGNTNAMTYQWGGAHQTESWAQFLSKAVADCSGLVEQVYKQFAGVNLGTTTAQGIYSDNNGGTKVSSQSQLQPGDIVFFGSDASHITHTGIYAGNGQDYAIDNTGKPVSLDNMAGQNYVGGKHFNIQSGTTSQNPADSATTPLQDLTSKTSTYHTGVLSALAIVGNTIPQITQKINDSIGQAVANGNIADVMGSSGVTGKYDAIAQARQDIATQMINNHDQINSALDYRNTVIAGMSSASKSGDTASYNQWKQQLSDTDSLIKSLQANTASLQSLDATYKAQQQSDPRLNLSSAHSIIAGGLTQLQTFDKNGSGMGVDYVRLVNEVNNMKSQYLDHTKETQSLSTLFGNYGAEAQWYSNSKATSDQDAINLVQTQITNINNLFKNLAQGTEQWYSTLDIAVQAEQQLHDLEQKRLQDAQTMFQLTGQGIQGYVEQRAYTQSKTYSQNNQDLQTALQQYKSGTLDKGSFLSSGEYYGVAGANATADYLRHTYGISANVQDMGVQYQSVGNVGKGVKVYSNPDGTGKVTESLASGNYKVYSSQNGYYGVGNAGWVKASDMTGVTDTYRTTTSADLTSGSVNSINSDLQSKGLSHLTYSSNAGSSTEDFNQQLANLQAIADAHNNMVQQMNDYKQAVTDSFKAGAMSVDEYISKLNQLRDKETEAKENAVNMVGTIQGGFQSSLSDAISNGLQGSLNSPLDFMNSIKSTIAGGLSSQLSQTLLQNTGLQDVMNKLTSSLTKASTSGNASDIVNMFNNNDFGKQMQDALAPFIPMIQQIVGSAQGIFTILKDQTFNAPSGFKVDNYMNEVANQIGYQGIKSMNPNVNSVGSQINTFPDTPPITTTAPSQTPTGVPTTTSGSGATQTGAPENTTGTGSTAPTTSQTSAPSIPSTPIPSAPKAPTTSTGSASSYHSGQVVHAHGNVWLHKTPDTNTSSRLKILPNGSAWKSYGFKNGMIDLGSGYADGKYVYHTGGIAGMMNFASGQGLKANELQAILQKSETVFQPRQVDDLVNGAMKAGANASNSGSGVNINVTVNFTGDSSNKSTIEETVQTAVQKALDQFKRTTKMNNLTWKGTSY